jgi:glycosyltransferase involved in cell wall biosynthesis
MDIVVLNSGSPQPVLRTLALSRVCNVLKFIETGPRSNNHALLENAGISVEFVRSTGKMDMLRLVSLLKRERADAYVCHYAAGSHVYAALLAGCKPLALVAMGNDVLYDEGDRPVPHLAKAIIRTAARSVDFISAKSLRLQHELRDWGVNCPIDVNYWGVDHSVFTPGDRLESRQVLNLPLKARILLSMRAFEPRCNVHLVAQAFVAIAQEIAELHIVFIGAASFPAYVQIVQGIIKDAGLSSRAHFVFGVGVHDVINYYRASDLGISVASAEGFPNSVLEMLACKAPVIVGRIPQIEELLVDRVNASLCSISLHGIAERMRWMLDPANKAEISTIVEAGCVVSKESADIIKNSDRFVQRLELLAKSHRHKFPLILLLLLLVEFLLRRAARVGSLVFRKAA